MNLQRIGGLPPGRQPAELPRRGVESWGPRRPADL